MAVQFSRAYFIHIIHLVQLQTHRSESGFIIRVNAVSLSLSLREHLLAVGPRRSEREERTQVTRNSAVSHFRVVREF